MPLCRICQKRSLVSDDVCTECSGADIGVRPYKQYAMSFEQLRVVIRTNRLELLGRSEAAQAEYDSFVNELRLVWRGTGDYLLSSKFNLPSSTDADGKRFIEPSQRNTQLSLHKNDFPYHFEPGMEHYVLWKLGQPLEEEEIKAARDQLLADEGGGAEEALYYVNPPHLKSILDIDHAHIIVKVRR